MGFHHRSDQHLFSLFLGVLSSHDLLVELDEYFITEGVIPRFPRIRGLHLDHLLIAIVVRLPDQLVHGIHTQYEEEGAEVDDQAGQVSQIAVPDKYVVLISIDLEALEQAEQAAKSFDIDDSFNDRQFGGRRQLLFDRWNQGNVAEYHCCDSSDSTCELGFLEKDGKTNKGKQKHGDEDGRQ